MEGTSVMEDLLPDKSQADISAKDLFELIKVNSDSFFNLKKKRISFLNNERRKRLTKGLLSNVYIAQDIAENE